jgi:hypothetical protein
MNFRTRLLAASVVALLMTGGAAAEARVRQAEPSQPQLTAEGAQTFLARLAAQGMLKLDRAWDFNQIGWNTYVNCRSGCAVKQSQVVQVASATAGSCNTVVNHNSPVHTGGGEIMDFYPASYPTQITVRWDRVTSVQRSGLSVILLGTWSDNIGNPYFNLDTEELAIRVQRAMEFLRASCDPTGGTGF